MNRLLYELKQADNKTFTENGAVTYKSTLNGLLDLFGMGAAYRNRSEDDVITLFEKAFEEDEKYALKCLFYLRDVRGGQGERRFFRVIINWLAIKHTDAMQRNLKYVPEFGRWDDLYAFIGTSLEQAAFAIIKDQLILDLDCKTPSLCAKWLKSLNTSSAESRRLAEKTRLYLRVTPRTYRKLLTKLRNRIRIVETLMSQGKWDEIEFDKIPSKAGFKYRNAFARHDIERMRSEKNVRTYEDFMKDTTTKVNAKDLYPYEVVQKAREATRAGYSPWDTGRFGMAALDSTQRAVLNKYWDNLTDYFNGASLDALCMIDTSGSMLGRPMDVAISLGLYAAERARGPFRNHYISFSSRPQLIETRGRDFVEKVERIWKTNLCENTNIEAAFDMLLTTAKRNDLKQRDLPKSIVIISDMQWDSQVGRYGQSDATLMENIVAKWARNGYTCPSLVYWNVDARRDTVPMQVKNGVTLCSGFSPSLFEQIMKGKTGYDLMMDKLNESRYACIH